jgi:hypothetical protein
MSDNHTALQQIEAETDHPAATTPLINPFTLFAQRNRGGGFFRGPLIKCEHTSGEFFRVRGEARTLIEGGERFIVNPHELTDTWTKWINGKVVDRRVYRAINGEIAPAREELGALDENYWPTSGKKPKDPWQRQVYLPMKGNDGEVCAFSATGQSAISEIAELVGMYGETDRHGKFPVIELDTRSFESQHGSTIYVPVFRLVDWDFWEPGTPASPVALVPMPTAAPAIATTRKVTDNNDDDAEDMSAPVRLQKKRNSARDDLDDTIPF